VKEITATIKKRRIAIWLLVGVFMIIIQIIIGGITRLTGSGLSITEWKPIMGAIPPMNHDAWLAAFQEYQKYPQFKYLNAAFTLSDFKFIYFWEWFHRLWARSLGVVFAIPFIYFLIKKYFSKDMVWPLVLLFILGGLQGLVGWIMVQSGLTDTNIHVSYIRLTIHFIAALILLIYTFWFALKLLIPEQKITYDSTLKQSLLFIIVIFAIQLIYGGFMAGLKAANFAPTWPSINGQVIPSGIMQNSWVDHPINVHFIHRGIAYLLFFLILWSFFKVRKIAKATNANYLLNAAKWPLVFVVMQVLLGILTVLSSLKIVRGHFGVFETLAELHQITALLLLLSLIYQYYLVRKNAIVI